MTLFIDQCSCKCHFPGITVKHIVACCCIHGNKPGRCPQCDPKEKTVCDRKIRPFVAVPTASAVELECEVLTEPHDHHSATLKDYAYPGSKTIISWLETDRRNFTGGFRQCRKQTFGQCCLPQGHRGECAV